MIFNSSSAFLSFERVIQHVETWLKKTTSPLFNYAQSIVVARLAQRIIELGLFDYVQLCAKRHDDNLNSVCIEHERFSCAGMVFNQKLGEVRLSWKVLLRAIAEFWLHWFHVFYISTLALLRFDQLIGLFIRSKSFKPPHKATLLFGVGKEAFNKAEGDIEFVEYCRKGDINPLIVADHIIVQSATNLQSIDNSFSYSRFPLHTLMQRNPMGFYASLTFLFQHISVLFVYLTKTFQCPPIALLGRDFAYQAMADSLNNRGLIEAVVITNSNYSAQPLWMRKSGDRNFIVHMIWYSQNIIPFIYVDDMVSAAVPNYRYLSADEHWLWTESFAKYLKSLSLKGAFHLVSPIMWYLPKVVANPIKKSGQIKVTVFDVTPVNKAYANEIGIYKNYYNIDNCNNFINSVITTCETVSEDLGVKVNVYLKHKRAFFETHDVKYVQLIKELNDSKRLTLVEHDSNIFNLIGSSQLVIVMPYSSPAIIASNLKVPAVYFDASNTLAPISETHDTLQYVSDKKALYELIKKVIVSNGRGT